MLKMNFTYQIPDYKYLNVTLEYKNTIMVFKSGDPVIDWLDAIKEVCKLNIDSFSMFESNLSDFIKLFNYNSKNVCDCIFVDYGYFEYTVITPKDVTSFNDLVQYYQKFHRTRKIKELIA